MSEQQTEDTSVDTGEVVEYADGQMDYLSERIAEVQEEYGSDETDADETEAEDSQEEAETEDESVDEEPTVDDKINAFARLMEKEQDQRKAAEQLKVRERELESKYSEVEAELDEYKKAKEDFATDPLAYLQALGASDDDLDTIAKLVYYRTLGEDAPAEFGQLKDKFQTKQELKKLKEQLRQQDEAKKSAAQEKEDAAWRETYVESLFEAAEAIPDEYPLAKKYTEEFGDQKVVGILYNYAEQNAKAMNYQGAALTPEQGLAILEKELVALTKLNAEPAPDAPAKPKKKKRTLRNKQSTIQSPYKDYEGMTDEEVVKEARRRANAILRAGGHIKD